jgi:hypothetical protein
LWIWKIDITRHFLVETRRKTVQPYEERDGGDIGSTTIRPPKKRKERKERRRREESYAKRSAETGSGSRPP